MRTISRIDLELGNVIDTLQEDAIDIYGQCEIDGTDSLTITDSIYSDIYLSNSMIEGNKSKVRIRKEGIGDKARFMIKLPEYIVGNIYVVRSMRAYKYIINDNKITY